MGTVRVGMVGGGFMGRVSLLALGALGGLAHATVPRIGLTRVADRSLEAAERTAAAWGWRRRGADRRAVIDDAEVPRGNALLCEKRLSNAVRGAQAMDLQARGIGQVP